MREQRRREKFDLVRVGVVVASTGDAKAFLHALRRPPAFPPRKRAERLRWERDRAMGGRVAQNDWHGEDRRSGVRPSTGDRRRCPKCADTMRFYERYVVHRGVESNTQPAWVCRCGYEQYVRLDLLQRPEQT